MDYSHFMQILNSVDHLGAVFPCLLLTDAASLLLSLVDQALEVPSLCILHYDSKRACSFFKESFFVCDYLRMAQRGKNSHLIECIFTFFLTQTSDVDPKTIHEYFTVWTKCRKDCLLFDCINFPIFNSLGLSNSSKRTCSYRDSLGKLLKKEWVT